MPQLTLKEKKEIARRLKAGEVQRVLVQEYPNASKGAVARIASNLDEFLKLQEDDTANNKKRKRKLKFSKADDYAIALIR